MTSRAWGTGKGVVSQFRSCEHLEQQLGAAAAEADVPQFIDDQKIDLAQRLEHSFQAVLLLGRFQLIHQRGGGVELDPLARPASCLAQCNGDVGFS